jgi:DNA-binding Xre family transcriptional regulator
MPRIENRFLELLAEKRRRDRRRWTYREIHAETGIAPSALSKLAQQGHAMYDSATIARLCQFLECSVGDLLVLVPDDENDTTKQGQEMAVAAS